MSCRTYLLCVRFVFNLDVKVTSCRLDSILAMAGSEWLGLVLSRDLRHELNGRRNLWLGLVLSRVLRHELNGCRSLWLGLVLSRELRHELNGRAMN